MLTTFRLKEATLALLEAGYVVEQQGQELHVRVSVNSYPTRLQISWLGTVSERSIRALLKKKRVG